MADLFYLAAIRPANIEELKATVTVMWVGLLVLSLLILGKPEMPKRKAAPSCPLHRVPRTECQSQHAIDDDPTVEHEHPTPPS